MSFIRGEEKAGDAHGKCFNLNNLRSTICVLLRATRRFWPAGKARFPAENPPPVLNSPRVAGATELLRLRADRGLDILVAAQPYSWALAAMRGVFSSVMGQPDDTPPVPIVGSHS